MADITGMQPAGKVLPIWRGDYNNSAYYEQTDIVLYNNSSYIAKQDTIGNPPPEPADNANEYWQLVAKGIVDADVSDATVEFGEAEKRKNIESGEDVKTLFGKIKKWFADDKATNDKNGRDITKTYAEKSLVGVERAIDGTSNIEYSYPNTATGQSMVSMNINTLNTAVKESTQKITDSVLSLKLANLSRNNYINVLTNINQITSIGFWKIGSIDSSYAQSIGIRPADNVGDFYAIVANYNGDGVDHYYFGNLLLFSPRLGVNYFTIQIWNEVATARRMITHDNLLNTTEQISANTESFYAAGALAVKAMMADYNNKINQINSNMAGIKVFFDIKSINTNLDWTTATFNDIYAAMPNASVAFLSFETNAQVLTEHGFSNGGAIVFYKGTPWRGVGILSIYNNSTFMMANVITRNTLVLHRISFLS